MREESFDRKPVLVERVPDCNWKNQQERTCMTTRGEVALQRQHLLRETRTVLGKMGKGSDQRERSLSLLTRKTPNPGLRKK